MVFILFCQCRKVLRSLWPRSAVRLSHKGARLRERGKADEAIAVLDQAIGLDSQLAEAYAHRCACYCDRKEHVKAIEDADRAIALDPKMAWVYWARSWSWYCLDELDSALADMDEALKLEPQNAAFQHSRAQVLFGLDRIDEAAAQYEAALVQDPDFRGGWLGAVIAVRQGKWKEAIELLDVVLETDSTNARGYYDRGEAWYRLHEYENALRDLDEALQLEPDGAIYLYFRAGILCNLHRFEEALAGYEAVLVQHDWPNKKLREMAKVKRDWVSGVIALQHGNLTEAIEHLDAALEAIEQLEDVFEGDESVARVYNDRGEAWYRLGKYEPALRDFDKAVKLHPEHSVHYINRAYARMGLVRCGEVTRDNPLGEYEIALRDLDNAVKLEPERAQTLHSRAEVLFELGRFDDAATQYESALVQDPDLRGDWLGGAIALKQGKFREAIELFDVVLKVDPTSARVYYDRGEAWYRLREYKNALRDLDEAIRLRPTVAACQFSRAHVLLELGRVDEASAQYEAALAQDSESKGRWLGGEIALNQGKFREAIEQFNAVLEVDSSNVRAYHYRGEAWYQLGEYQSALRDFDEAARLAPDCVGSHRFLAWIRATCPEADMRNGKLAVAMAHKVVELAGGKPNSGHCSVLAAAYAESGDFAEAIRWQLEALATAAEKSRSTQQARLERYQAGMPLRIPDTPDSGS